MVPLLTYVACLGYGYLAVETVLIHELVLFVGHPTYAVTVVVLAMLLSSGAGSIWAGTPEPSARNLRRMLGGVLILGVVQAFVVPPLLYGVGLGWPLPMRTLATFVALLPLGFAMGCAFPFAMRLIPESLSPAVPWAWAINAWMSVVGSVVTVMIARLWGYPHALGAALIAYALAALLAGRLEPGVRRA